MKTKYLLPIALATTLFTGCKTSLDEFISNKMVNKFYNESARTDSLLENYLGDGTFSISEQKELRNGIGKSAGYIHAADLFSNNKSAYELSKSPDIYNYKIDLYYAINDHLAENEDGLANLEKVLKTSNYNVHVETFDDSKSDDSKSNHFFEMVLMIIIGSAVSGLFYARSPWD